MELQTELFIRKLEDKKMEENRKKIHEMVDCMNTEEMLAYWETFMRLWLEEWGGDCL